MISAMPKGVLLLFVLSVELLAAPAGARPTFQDFPVAKIYRGQAAAPKLVGKQQRTFRTMIRQGAKSKVEFAGHYTVPTWGCGGGCAEFVIADSITGRVYDGLSATELPLEWSDEHKDSPKEHLEFHPDSRLLKINGCPNELNCGFYDYEMVEGTGLRLVRKELLPKKYQPQ
jgi:hypothetical protein